MAGLRCPSCHQSDVGLVVNTRKVEFWEWRRRQCSACGHTWTMVRVELTYTPRLKEFLWEQVKQMRQVSVASKSSTFGCHASS